MFRITPGIVMFAAALCGVPDVGAQNHPVTRMERTNTGYQDAPLLEAHQNLLLARARMAEQDYAGTAASLADAQKALADFAAQDHGPLGLQAEFIRQDMESYVPHIGRDVPIDQIDSWIETIEHWMGNARNPLQPPPPW